MACAPNGSTTNATVTQCNGSVTGGGTYAGEPTAACTVTGAATADPVTINQCNGTATGGGSAVTCMATVADVFAAATTTPTSAPTGTGGANGAAVVGGTVGGSGGEQLEPAGQPESPVRRAPLQRSFRRVPLKPVSAEPPNPRTRPWRLWAAWLWPQPR